MRLKLDENGNVVVIDGKPVYIHDDGKEIAFDAVQATNKIAELNNECKTHRLAKEKAEADLKKFEVIGDPDKAIKALEVVKNLDDKTLIDAGEVEKVKSGIIRQYEEKLSAKDAELNQTKQALNQEVIGGSFARSKYIAEKLNIPVDMVQAYFGKHFSYEDGKIIAKDMLGNVIFSRIRPGEQANFEEAIEQIVMAYPHKEHILKASGNSGGGSGGGTNSVSDQDPFSKEHWNMTKQAELLKTNPTLAKQLAAKHGIKL
ncbi:DUF6651 domain-containing protein [Gallibacterium genomosp. 3]|uniref:DUF6651 domain-containing protein n=1 Tax=Gallibacterium genomosp. 3 TaxID=505345 RepID=UPI0008027D53|nr:DUF6651 domain-containing protein [Gallibacterium genomosp. 3]